jgi:hypothetical protein
MAYQGSIAINPRKTKCVYATLDGEIIHFYNIIENEISLISKTEKAYPKYKPEDNGTEYYSSMDANNTIGYISLAATDRFVYALYCGKKYNELYRAGNRPSIAGEQLRIFDWTGTIVKTVMLDVPCQHISATNDNRRLWAMAILPEITPVYFDLDENVSFDAGQSSAGKVSKEQNSASVSMKKDGSPKVNQLNAGKIKLGETKKYILPMLVPVTSHRTSSEDIILRDSVDMSNKSYIIVNLTKQKTGVFNDTVYLSLDSNKITLVISGEVLK